MFRGFDIAPAKSILGEPVKAMRAPRASETAFMFCGAQGCSRCLFTGLSLKQFSGEGQ